MISRMFLGLHFPSDNDFGVFCAKAIAQSKEFTTKYGL
jgi:membrane-associated phospholipid phosphatase